MTKTECKWGRPTRMAWSFRLHRPFHTDDNGRPGDDRYLGTPCGGAECPDRRKGPERRRWCRGVTWQDGDRRAPGQETDRRKGERRQGRELHGRGRFWIDNKKIALGFCWPKDNRSGKDRRQPVCGNPECGGAVGTWEGDYNPETGTSWHTRHVADHTQANPPGQAEGPCKRGRKRVALMGDAIKGVAEKLAMNEPQSAGLVERLRSMISGYRDWGNPAYRDYVVRKIEEAAAEIERFEAKLAERDALVREMDHALEFITEKCSLYGPHDAARELARTARSNARKLRIIEE